MALLDSAVSASAKATKLHLHPDNTVDDAVRQFLAGVVTHILENIHIAAAGRDPEGLHQVRIALRRFRSGIGLFRPYLHRRAAAMNKRARWALRRLGTARDIDVLVLETLPRILKDGAIDQRFPSLAEIFRERTVDARRDVRSLAFDPPFNCFLLDLLAGNNDTAIAAQDLTRLLDNRRRDIESRLPAKWKRVARAEPFWRSGTLVTPCTDSGCVPSG